MAITAALVKQLRERTGSGMMECKKALVETDGDIDAAAELMRKQGLAKADKKAGRVAAEGRIVIETDPGSGRTVILEANCETDFVSSGEDFGVFAEAAAKAILAHAPADIEALAEVKLDSGESVEEARRALIARIGENVTLRRFRLLERGGDRIGSYLHGSRIGVVIDLAGGDEELARDLAMHIAASRPVCVTPDDVPAGMVDKEREILVAQASDSGKPPEIIEKMVEGRLRKFLSEITLYGQPFVKDPDQTVEKLLKQAGARVLDFERLEVGEGIEKQEGNFAEEVMAQVRDS